MNLIQKVRNGLNDDLKTFKVFERTIAAICIAIPVFLKLADTGSTGFRSSISDYVYMSKSYIFGMLLCTAAMLFIFNGAVYFRNEKNFRLGKHGKWYNVVLGISLLGVILFPYCQFAIIHYTFATIFFLGNALVIGLFHNRNDRMISITLALLTISSLVLHFLNLFTLFWAEWLSLAVIGIHFILQAAGVISLNLEKSQERKLKTDFLF